MVTITVTNVDEDPKLTGPASVRVSEATTPREWASTYKPTEPTYAATDDEDGVDSVAVVLTKSGPDAALFSLADGDSVSRTRPTSRPRRMWARTTYTT